MFYFTGSGYIPSPRPGTGQSFADVGIDSEFVPFPRPGLVQSFEDVAEGPGFVPFPRQPSTMQDETTPNGAETESANVSVNGGETSSIRNARGRKRKRGQVQQPDNTNMVDLMSTFFADMHSQIGQLVSKVGAEADACSKRKELLDALDKLSNLSVEDKLDAAKFLAKNSEYMDIFYGLTDENKATMVNGILKGPRF